MEIKTLIEFVRNPIRCMGKLLLIAASTLAMTTACVWSEPDICAKLLDSAVEIGKSGDHQKEYSTLVSSSTECHKRPFYWTYRSFVALALEHDDDAEKSIEEAYEAGIEGGTAGIPDLVKAIHFMAALGEFSFTRKLFSALELLTPLDYRHEQLFYGVVLAEGMVVDREGIRTRRSMENLGDTPLIKKEREVLNYASFLNLSRDISEATGTAEDAIPLDELNLDLAGLYDELFQRLAKSKPGEESFFKLYYLYNKSLTMLIINEIIYENDPYNCSKITRALSDELYGMEGESLEEVFDEIVITEEFVRKCLRAADNLVLENWTNDQLETEVHLLNLAGNLGEAERLARLLSSR